MSIQILCFCKPSSFYILWTAIDPYIKYAIANILSFLVPIHPSRLSYSHPQGAFFFIFRRFEKLSSLPFLTAPSPQVFLFLPRSARITRYFHSPNISILNFEIASNPHVIQQEHPQLPPHSHTPHLYCAGCFSSGTSISFCPPISSP